jgi:hypothetical protein
VVLTDTAGTQAVTLTGTATAPVVMLNPTRLTFATQIIKTSSKPQTVTLTNSGTATLSIATIAVTGASAPDFTQTNNCPTQLATNATCSITVVFKSSGINARTAAVTITDDALDSPQSVPLSGVGTQVKITPPSLNFGKVVVSSSATKNLTLANVGATAVNISGISIIGANASDFSDNSGCGSVVAAKSKCTISVTFTPSAKGARSATFQINDDGGGSPQSVSLTGTGK